MGAMRLCFLLFSFFLTSVSPFRKLSNIQDLKNITYAKSAPRHGLQLLFWFAQKVVTMDQNNIPILDSNFDPSRGDFGFHHYGNREGILPLLSSWQSYYSGGNLKSPGANAMPAYVRKYYRNTNVPERNMDRLIISVKENKPNKILSVFITAYDLHKNDFNPDDTYEIDPALFLQIGEPNNCTVDESGISGIYTISRNTENTEYDRCLQFLTEAGYSSTDCKHSHISRRKKRSPYLQCNAYEGIKLEIKATTEGFSKLLWEIPAKMMENSKYVYIEICQNTRSSETNEVHTQVRNKLNIYESSGASDTPVSLTPGLQPRLRLYPSLFDFQFTNPYIWYGPEFDGANRVIPITIKGYDASLQLYAEDGKACARLYIKKTFSNWKNVFDHSWVGFYKSTQDKNNDYSAYQYADKFTKIENYITHIFDIYQYNSSLAIAPGVQIRFLLDKKYDKVLAQTTSWEGAEAVTISPSDCGPSFQPKISNVPEFFYGPEFNDVGLQLYTEDGKACARLYIKKTFTDWKEIFYYSWVGFYSSSQDKDADYYTYHYVVKFEKMEVVNEIYDIYQYKSKLDIGPGVQIRLLKDKSTDYVFVKTEPWKNG
ncbi:hypothetical protein ROHU_025258 [Labeo rohita]|uniref:Uncharacterized protein n=1 Tax=Labeo rohita TaxID=84645 RepID=A0A498LEA7_LABRO|nr:hypothetical protein ROHU_012715 [Labeo rohita]RXN20104.1 hypothetical protein ROHU_025258 [Labeo rohita]